MSGAAWRCHAASLAAAALAGAVAYAFALLDVQGVRLVAEARAVSPLLPPLLLLVAMVAISRLRDLVFPGTEGTGIPQVIAALSLPEGRAREAILSLRVAAGKFVLLAIALLTGMTLGREGPSVHVGAALLRASGRLASFPAWAAQRGLLLAGGAAGIAAAFNAPVAGIVFSIEEIGRSFDKRAAGLLVRTVLVACLVPIAFAGDQVFYGRMHAAIRGPEGWAAVALLGVGGGLLGGLFSRALLAASPRYTRLSGRWPWLAPAALGLVLAALAFATEGVSQGGGFEHARRILQTGEAPPPDFVPARALSTFVCLLSRIPGGLFDPSLALGAGLGSLVTPLFSGVEPRAVVLLAMVAYFSGVVQSPITAGVILVEMTRAAELAIPLLAAAIVAYEASRLVCPTALYEGLAEGFLERRTPG